VEEEVGKLRSGEKAVEVRDPEIRLPLPMLVPDEYMDDKHLRLMAYRRIAGAQTAEDLTDLYREMENRFGPVPKQLFNLFSVVRLKQICRANGVGLLEYAPPWVRLDLSTAKEEVQLGATRLAVNPPCPLKVEANGMVELKPAGGGAPLDQVRRSLVLLGLAQEDDVYLNPK
jgi:transcription-repair coupling factor (superfamily II helicase)